MGHLVDARRVAERALGHPLSYRDASAFWTGRVIDFAVDEPAEALALVGRKALLAVNAYEIPNNESYAYLAGRSAILDLFPAAGWLFPLGLAGLVLGLRGAAAERMPLYLLFAGLVLGVVLTLVTWRYRLPLTLALWPAAGYTLARGALWLKERRWLPLGGLVLLLVAGLGLSRLPPMTAADEAKHLKQAQQRMDASGAELAMRRELAAGNLEADRSLDLWVRLARHREGQNDWEGALAVLREGLAAHPREARLLSAQIPLLLRLGEQGQVMAVQRELALSRRPPAPLGPDEVARPRPSGPGSRGPRQPGPPARPGHRPPPS